MSPRQSPRARAPRWRAARSTDAIQTVA